MMCRVKLRCVSVASAALVLLLGAVLAAGLASGLGACASSAPAVTGPTAECPVCRHEGDLACVCVHVEPETPKCDCAGQTYYFCSEQCREDFVKHPERYTGK
jgi:YHS domain-containing protein